MAKKEWGFWALVVSFVFGVALEWPVWSKFITITLAGAVLAQVCGRLAQAYGGKER